MFRFRRVLIARLISNETLSCTKGVAVFRTRTALYGLFVVETIYGERRRRPCLKVSYTGKPL